MSQPLLGPHEVAGVGDVEHVFARRRGSGVEGGEPEIHPDDLLGSPGGHDGPLNIDGEGDGPRATTLGDGGGDNSAGASFEVSVKLAHGLVGFHRSDATDAHVVGVCEPDCGVREPNGTSSPLRLERGELSRAPAPVRESPTQTLRGVVVGGSSVLTPPRSRIVTVSRPEVEQVEVRGGEVVVLRDLVARVPLRTVLVPVVLHQSQQGVVAEARTTDVAAQQVGLLGRRVERVGVSLGDSARRRIGRAHFDCRGHQISIGSWCDIYRAPSCPKFAEATTPILFGGVSLVATDTRSSRSAELISDR